MRIISAKTPLLPLLLIAATAPACVPVRAQNEPSFRVIVNASNPVESLSKSTISEFFLKPRKDWPHGSQVAPVDQKPGSEVREHFSVHIHGRHAQAVRAHWQRLIFQGRGVPPPTRASEREIVDFVSAHPNAIGYVSKVVPGAKVKVVNITD